MKKRTITLLDDEATIYIDQDGFYPIMLNAIIERVLILLGPEFDKQAYIEEVEGGRPAAEIGQELAIPVCILLSLELGHCLGQLKVLGMPLDHDQALKDLYEIWKASLKRMIRDEILVKGPLH